MPRLGALLRPSSNSHLTSEPIDPDTVDYFHGYVSRSYAEELLLEDGRDGIFLLRRCRTYSGGFAVSVLSHQRQRNATNAGSTSCRVYHYAIDHNADKNMVSIEGGKEFIGPIELVNYHKQKKSGMVVKLREPYNRPIRQNSPFIWFGVTKNVFDDIVNDETIKAGGRPVDLNIIVSQLHTEQPWFHSDIRREEADQRLRSAGRPLPDGTFLIRERTSDGTMSYALSLICRGTVWHYVIDNKLTPRGQRRLGIAEGPPFENLMDLVTYYHCGGLYCELTTACVRPNFRARQITISPALRDSLNHNPVYIPSSDREMMLKKSAASVSGSSQVQDGISSVADQYLHPGSSNHSAFSMSSTMDLQSSGRSFNGSTDPLSTMSSQMGSVQSIDGAGSSDFDVDAIYSLLRQHFGQDLLDVRPGQLSIGKKLGSGQFGTVKLAYYQTSHGSYEVAVKALRNESNVDEPLNTVLMKEAGIMSELDYPHIIRMIGLCKSRGMLILEYAPYGQLNDYLKRNRETTSMDCVMELMLQVAKGMSYLASKGVVHRDLAARNILLMNPQFAKISDFGLSRDMATTGKDYYKAHPTKNEKWPIKWYAPECLKHRKFDSMSDVWSYGVTLWEATSYGETPYKGYSAKEYQRAVKRRDLLKKPVNCPRSVYGLMSQCWLLQTDDRPTFSEIVKQLKRMTFAETLDSGPDVIVRDTALKENY